MKIAFKKEDFRNQIVKDQELFDSMPNNVKNALVSELKKFWPKAHVIWPEKFSYEQRDLFAGTQKSSETS